MKKTKPLSQKNIDDTIETIKRAGIHATQISNRVQYIFDTIAKSFKTGIDWWDWPNGTSDYDGTPRIRDLQDGELYFSGQWRKGDKEMIAMIDGSEWNFVYLEFPFKWLTEDFEDELKDGIKKYKEHLVKKKERQSAAKIKKAAKKKAVLAKLSAEDKKVLGLK